ncbi:MAG: hypothetical protein E6H10_19195 [Bacteroidetes bacterium]|nr:MAG: hypothetical protein E6H10_19195 [Bacteroidota bacterium]
MKTSEELSIISAEIAANISNRLNEMNLNVTDVMKIMMAIFSSINKVGFLNVYNEVDKEEYAHHFLDFLSMTVDDIFQYVFGDKNFILKKNQEILETIFNKQNHTIH